MPLPVSHGRAVMDPSAPTPVTANPAPPAQSSVNGTLTYASTPRGAGLRLPIIADPTIRETVASDGTDFRARVLGSRGRRVSLGGRSGIDFNKAPRFNSSRPDLLPEHVGEDRSAFVVGFKRNAFLPGWQTRERAKFWRVADPQAGSGDVSNDPLVGLPGGRKIGRGKLDPSFEPAEVANVGATDFSLADGAPVSSLSPSSMGEAGATSDDGNDSGMQMIFLAVAALTVFAFLRRG